MCKLRMGFCGWRFPVGGPLVCPTPAGIERLGEYAREYDTVELDNWFWPRSGGEEPELPQPCEVEAYRQAVPPGFRFTAKVPYAITRAHDHGRTAGAPPTPNPHFLSADLLCRFVESLEPLGDRLGPLILQLGALGSQTTGGQEELLERLSGLLDRAPTGRQYALDVVSRDHCNAALFGLIARHRLVPVFVQDPSLEPSVSQIYGTWRRLVPRPGAVVMKLEAGNWSSGTVDRIRLDGPAEDDASAIADVARELLDGGVDVYLNVVDRHRGPALVGGQRTESLLKRHPPGNKG